jgi:hypothetical protein
VAAGAADQAASGAPPPVPFPEGFRRWAHVKSAAVWPSTDRNATFSGLHNIYANEPALAGYRTGTFPEEAVIVFDLFDLEQAEGSLRPIRRKSVDVMVRDSSARGGWRFESFSGGNPAARADAQVTGLCLACHLREPQGDMVFSAFVE